MVDPDPNRGPDHREDLAFEPHLQAGPGHDSAPAGSEREDEQIERSVADEPALGWASVDRARIPGYREHLARRIGEAGRVRIAITVVLLAMAAGPFAVLGALMEGVADTLGVAGYLAIIVIGPVAEEMMKVAAVLWTVERKPWLLPGSLSIVMVGLCGGVGFAALENLIYLHVYFPDPSEELVRWRWTICVAMHGACSAIAAVGVAHVWRTTMRTGNPAQAAQAFPFLATAMILHGAYNALAVAMSMFGLTPE